MPESKRNDEKESRIWCRFKVIGLRQSLGATMDQIQSAPNQSKATQPPSPPQPLHQSDADEEDENVKQLDDCSSLYLSMQECIVNSNRDWKACQMEVKALKACMEKRKSDKGS